MPGAGLLVSLYWARIFKTEACVVRPPLGQRPGLVRPSQVRGGGHLDMLDARKRDASRYSLLTTGRNKGPE